MLHIGAFSLHAPGNSPPMPRVMDMKLGERDKQPFAASGAGVGNKVRLRAGRRALGAWEEAEHAFGSSYGCCGRPALSPVSRLPSPVSRLPPPTPSPAPSAGRSQGLGGAQTSRTNAETRGNVEFSAPTAQAPTRPHKCQQTVTLLPRNGSPSKHSRSGQRPTIKMRPRPLTVRASCREHSLLEEVRRRKPAHSSPGLSS